MLLLLLSWFYSLAFMDDFMDDSPDQDRSSTSSAAVHNARSAAHGSTASLKNRASDRPHADSTNSKSPGRSLTNSATASSTSGGTSLDRMQLIPTASAVFEYSAFKNETLNGSQHQPELNSKEGVSRGRASMDAAGVPTYIQDQDSELIQDLRDALLERRFRITPRICECLENDWL